MPSTPYTTLYAEIDRHFLAPEALKRAALLGRAGPDAGGWFKGELVYLLDSLLKAGSIDGWRAERPDHRGQPPALSTSASRRRIRSLWLEVKAISDPARAGPLADTAMFARGEHLHRRHRQAAPRPRRGAWACCCSCTPAQALTSGPSLSPPSRAASPRSRSLRNRTWARTRRSCTSASCR